jgi:hypothetical protein
MRQCGDCTLCCKLLAVRALGKLAGQRCQHQRRTGCRVYHRAGMPMECAMWNCRWLVNDDTADLPRPDRCHYVVDVMPDFIEARDNETGEMYQLEAVQVWVDPKHRDAHKDPALRAYLLRRAQEGKVALIRYSATEAFTLLAPPSCADGQWHEVVSENLGRDHSFMEIIETLSQPTERIS